MIIARRGEPLALAPDPCTICGSKNTLPNRQGIQSAPQRPRQKHPDAVAKARQLTTVITAR